MSVVHESGGHIADHPSLRGVVEIVDATLGGNVSSTLPPSWEDPANMDNPSSNRNTHRSHRREKRIGNVFLVAAIAGTVLIVFASFNLLPGSGLLMKPVRMVLSAVEKVVAKAFEIWGNVL
jgi:hypothetical protein